MQRWWVHSWYKFIDRKYKGEPKNVAAHPVLLDEEYSCLSPNTENQTSFWIFWIHVSLSVCMEKHVAADILVSDSFCLFHYDQVMWGEKKRSCWFALCALYFPLLYFLKMLFFFFFFHFNGALLKWFLKNSTWLTLKQG